MGDLLFPEELSRNMRSRLSVFLKDPNEVAQAYMCLSAARPQAYHDADTENAKLRELLGRARATIWAVLQHHRKPAGLDVYTVYNTEAFKEFVSSCEESENAALDACDETVMEIDAVLGKVE